jgi:hypothetical protein
VHSTAPFGKLRVFLVDPIDIFVGKTFSKRDKAGSDFPLLILARLLLKVPRQRSDPTIKFLLVVP